MAAKKKKSTTRSDTSLESLDLYTFFLDRASESKVLYEALKAKGARVEMHRDYYKDDEDDSMWLPEVSAKEWVIISQIQFKKKVLLTSTSFGHTRNCPDNFSLAFRLAN
jgi:hypothetical protein